MTRMIATVSAKNSNATRLMICAYENDVYVFGYTKEQDGSCDWDAHFENIDDAFEFGTEYGIQKTDWKTIQPLIKNCQQDWINPVRIKGRQNGTPEWGKFEKLVGNKWIEL